MSIYHAGRPCKFDPNSHRGSQPPKAAGEYRIRDASGKIAYIGESNDLNRRMHEHMRAGRLSGGTFEWQKADGRSTSNTRRSHERIKIARHLPYMNKSRGGEGRWVS